MQRFFDLILAVTAMLIISPLFLLVILILRFTGEGEIFFTQPRVGRFKKTIKIFKFATMMKNSPNMGTGTVTLKNDPRVLPFGRFLRKSKINELPQLINIITGDMSVIGPRPQTERCFQAFPKKSQDAIACVRPGLSGVGSIFFRNEENMLHDAENADRFYNEVIMPFKGELEEWYVQNQSATLYFKLILATLKALFSRKSAKEILNFDKKLKAPAELNKYV